jgi:putative Holliday junction resolvase
MKVLGLDYGDRYVGAAVGDTETGVAIPKTVLQHSGGAALCEAIAKLIEETGAQRLVVGLPLSFKMEETASAEKAKAFGRMLRREFHMPVDFENEVLSSSYAARLRPDAPKRFSHAVAASLILQSWLDRQKSDLKS